MSEIITVNLNQYATVRLTDHGRKIWHDAWEPYDKTGDMDKKVQPDGKLREQIWHIMQVFGPHIGMALPPVFAEVTMEIEHP